MLQKNVFVCNKENPHLVMEKIKFECTRGGRRSSGVPITLFACTLFKVALGEEVKLPTFERDFWRFTLHFGWKIKTP